MMRKSLTLPPPAAQFARYHDPVRVRKFYWNLCRMGITFTIDDAGRVVGSGRGMSPLLQSEIDHRAQLLRQIIKGG